MGLFSFLGDRPLTDKKIQKASKLASNPFAQPEVREKEMRRLLDDGSYEAISAVLKRFDVNASGNIADEEEKQLLEEALIELGETAQKPLESYIGRAKQLSYAMRAYESIAGIGEAQTFFLSVLHDYGPEDHRNTDAKLQIVNHLAENLEAGLVLEGLLPFLEDHSDDVQWVIVEILEKAVKAGQADSGVVDIASALLASLLFSDRTGPRILRRCAEFLVGAEWMIPGDQGAIPGLIDADYFLDKKRFLRKRIAAG